MKTSFASDNYAGIHPQILAAINQANNGHATSYGGDPLTARATELFKKEFGDQAAVFFVYNGTGANVLGLRSMLHSYQSVICPEAAHIQVDESTAPETFIGCKLIPVACPDGKLYPQLVEQKIQRLGDQHHPQAKAISISQSTEYGTVYQIEEIKALSALAKKYNLFFHMDGSRLANAVAALDASFRAVVTECGVDVLSFGGTKNGLMVGEALVFLNPDLAKDFLYIRKQGMQLHSKMRFISAQFIALLENGLWKNNAVHANRMAKKLANGLVAFPEIKITQQVEANAIFATMPPRIIPRLQEKFSFYVWNERTSEVRLMCSFDTREEDIDEFISEISYSLRNL